MQSKAVVFESFFKIIGNIFIHQNMIVDFYYVAGKNIGVISIYCYQVFKVFVERLLAFVGKSARIINRNVLTKRGKTGIKIKKVWVCKLQSDHFLLECMNEKIFRFI